MKHSVNIIVMVITIVAVVWVAMNFSDKSPFHEPVTPAEKALDATLKKVGDDDYLLENTHIRDGAVPAKHRIDYSHMLSKHLMDSLALQEKQMIAQDCGDTYLEGEVCGFDYNPILCAQDVSEVYYYQTKQEDAASASIDYSWPYKQNFAAAHFGLIKEKGEWKIDSVACTDD